MQDLKAFSDIITVIGENFSSRFSDFRLEGTVKFLKYPDEVQLKQLKLEVFEWIDLSNF